MIIGLTGYAGAGKDEVAKILVNKFGYQRVAFADAIRDFVYEINPIVSFVVNESIYLQQVVDRDGWDTAKKSTGVRQTLQNVGVAARNHFGDDFWVKRALDKIGYTGNYVITDVRFENEAARIKERDYSQLWRVKRPNVNPVNSHISETAMDGYKVDQIFVNGGSLEDLQALITTRMAQFV
jgi:cytidylate kinase